MEKRVEDFIKKRFNKDCNWLSGNCYYFAVILCARFPELKIYYLPIKGHFICGDKENFYDWTGKIEVNEPFLLFEEIKNNDPAWYNRLLRDCIF